MWNQPYRKNDLEGGAVPLYPMMLESPELRWAFIRKIYSILTVQLILTIAVASIVVALRPVQEFFATTTAGFALYIVLIITPFIGKNFLSLWVQIHRLIGLIIWLVDGVFFFLYQKCSSLSVVLLLPETSGELLSSWGVHRGSCLCSRFDLCFHQG